MANLNNYGQQGNPWDNPANYKSTRKKTSYSIKASMPYIGTKVHNYLEKADYVVDENKNRVVLTGTVGEQWTVSIQKLCSTYVIESTDEEITPESMMRKCFKSVNPSTGKEEIVCNEFRVSPRPNSTKLYAFKTEPNQRIQIKTSWGTVLQANDPSVPHGKGDYIVCSCGPDGRPNLNDRWIVNGVVFSTTYDMTSFPNMKVSDAEVEDLRNRFLNSTGGMAKLDASAAFLKKTAEIKDYQLDKIVDTINKYYGHNDKNQEIGDVLTQLQDSYDFDVRYAEASFNGELDAVTGVCPVLTALKSCDSELDDIMGTIKNAGTCRTSSTMDVDIMRQLMDAVNVPKGWCEGFAALKMVSNKGLWAPFVPTFTEVVFHDASSVKDVSQLKRVIVASSFLELSESGKQLIMSYAFCGCNFVVVPVFELPNNSIFEIFREGTKNRQSVIEKLVKMSRNNNNGIGADAIGRLHIPHLVYHVFANPSLVPEGRELVDVIRGGEGSDFTYGAFHAFSPDCFKTLPDYDGQLDSKGYFVRNIYRAFDKSDEAPELYHPFLMNKGKYTQKFFITAKTAAFIEHVCFGKAQGKINSIIDEPGNVPSNWL